MFNRKKTAALPKAVHAQQALTTILADPPVGVVPQALPEDEYIAVAQAVGLGQNKAVFTQEVLRFLQEQEVPVYPMHKVVAFMDKLVAHSNKFNRNSDYDYRWEWVALREADTKMIICCHYPNVWRYGLYEQPVPLPVLKRIQLVESKFAGRVAYGVSAIRYLPKGDPFLCVMAPNLEPHVIAHWDEPGFSVVG